MRQNKRLLIFYLACAVFNIGANTAHPVTPTIFTTLGLGSYMFGVALASQLVTNFLFSPFWGRLSAYLSSRTVLLITCCGYAGGQVLFGLARTEPAFVVRADADRYFLRRRLCRNHDLYCQYRV